MSDIRSPYSLSVCLSVYLSICLSVTLSIFLSLSLSFSLSRVGFSSPTLGFKTMETKDFDVRVLVGIINAYKYAYEYAKIEQMITLTLTSRVKSVEYNKYAYF